jgi:uncharacterized membrane protein YwzB
MLAISLVSILLGIALTLMMLPIGYGSFAVINYAKFLKKLRVTIKLLIKHF